MAEKLDPTPEDKPQSEEGSADLGTILKHLPSEGKPKSQVVGPDMYNLLMEDAPMKLTEEQVGFVRHGGNNSGSCGNCVHYYVSKVADRKVCEIFRPADESNIELGDVCQFFTTDGKKFPLQEKPQKQPGA